MPRKSVRRQFTFPEEYDRKMEKLMKIHGCVSKSELVRLAIRNLEDEAK